MDVVLIIALFVGILIVTVIALDAMLAWGLGRGAQDMWTLEFVADLFGRKR